MYCNIIEKHLYLSIHKHIYLYLFMCALGAKHVASIGAWLLIRDGLSENANLEFWIWALVMS